MHPTSDVTFPYTLGSRTGDSFVDALRVVAEAGIAIDKRIRAITVACLPAFTVRMRYEFEWWGMLMNRLPLAWRIHQLHRLGEQITLARDIGKNAMTMPGSRLAYIITLATREALWRRAILENYGIPVLPPGLAAAAKRIVDAKGKSGIAEGHGRGERTPVE